MELSQNEMAAVKKIEDENSEAAFQELESLQLVLVGGGIGETAI